MRGMRAEMTEIAAGGDQAPAEMVLPDAVDDEPGGQRIFRLHDPLRPAPIGVR